MPSYRQVNNDLAAAMVEASDPKWLMLSTMEFTMSWACACHDSQGIELSRDRHVQTGAHRDPIQSI